MIAKWRNISRAGWFIRLTHWEYWPFSVVYAPLYPYWLLLVLRSRSFFFFNTSNPGIRNGGFLMESKKEIYDQLPPGSYPETLLFRAGAGWTDIQCSLATAGLEYPLIAKPDIGMRGMRVQRVENEQELRLYAENMEVDFLVQSLVDYPLEAGIFYYRYPGETKGRISGIVGKEFLTVKGDGVSTIDALLSKDPRAVLQLPVLRETEATLLNTVLPAGCEKIIVPYGNHARGSRFNDCSDVADDALREVIDAYCSQVPDFHYGRLDIRFASWEDLKAGRHFSVIELNGAGSEPTHMYDPGHSLFYAWREIIRHWNILYRISRHNHIRRKIPYMRFSEGLRMLKDNSAYVRMIKKPLNIQADDQQAAASVQPAIYP